MSRSTRTSKALSKAFLWLALLLGLALPSFSSTATVKVWVEKEMGRGGAASVRQRGVEEALGEALARVTERHTDEAQRQSLSKELQGLFAKPGKFVSRYSVVAESEHVEEGLYRLALSADIDREALFEALTKAGFKVVALPLMPRVLLIPAADGEAASKAAQLARDRFAAEGVDATVYEASDPANLAPRDYSKLLHSGGFHLGLLVEVEEPGAAAPEEAALPVGEAPASQMETPPAVETSGPVRVELKGRVELFDPARGAAPSASGFQVENFAPLREDALQGALEKAAEALFLDGMSLVSHSGWQPGTATLPISLKVSGFDSPGDLLSLDRLLKELVEFKDVSLVKVESRSAQWAVTALDAKADWLAVLSRLKPGKGRVSWKTDAAGGTPSSTLAISGTWLPK